MITWVQDVMASYGIDVVLFDDHSASMVGGIDAIACRLMVASRDYHKALRALRWEARVQGLSLDVS